VCTLAMRASTPEAPDPQIAVTYCRCFIRRLPHTKRRKARAQAGAEIESRQIAPHSFGQQYEVNSRRTNAIGRSRLTT
jgi:hypothetical protein